MVGQEWCHEQRDLKRSANGNDRQVDFIFQRDQYRRKVPRGIPHHGHNSRWPRPLVLSMLPGSLMKPTSGADPTKIVSARGVDPTAGAAADKPPPMRGS